MKGVQDAGSIPAGSTKRKFMIVCSCRVIKTTDYKTKEELIERIMRTDFVCGRCTRAVHTIPFDGLDQVSIGQ